MCAGVRGVQVCRGEGSASVQGVRGVCVRG